jgi:outer membrane receptor for ferrienterochelin and colicin
MNDHQTQSVARRRQVSRRALLSGAGLFALCSAAQADPPPATGGIEVVVVTAEKHEEAINSVPMSITAVSGSELQQRGINGLQGLAAVVPGFNYTESKVGTPIYTLRGLGFSDIAMGGRPTVSVYADEAPIPFTIETVDL